MSPSTGLPGTTKVVTGVGLAAALDPANANASVALTRAGMTATWDDLFECTPASAQIVSDTKVVCILPVGVTEGAYIVVVASDDTSAAAGFETVVSASAAYTAATF